MKTIRLVYPDYLSGGLDEYYFGSLLMSHIIPENDKQKTVIVPLAPPDGKRREIIDGIYAKDEVVDAINKAKEKIESESPDRIITIGGNCMVSVAPFDYLHKTGKKTGILWLDAHPDVSNSSSGYANAHSMVLSSLMAKGEDCFTDLMNNRPFESDEILYIGLQSLLDYQKKFLDDVGVSYTVQNEKFLSDGEIISFIKRFDQILVHLDIDVLDEKRFHSTYFANPELTGDGSSGGRMSIEKLSQILSLIADNSDIRGFTIAEYLPFDEYKLRKMFSQLKIFTE